MLRDAHDNLAALIESTEDYICSVDLDYRLLTFNRALAQDLARRYGRKLRGGMSLGEMFPPQIAASWRSLLECAVREGSYRIEYPLDDGRVLEMALNPMVVGGKTTGISVFAKNITGQKAIERELIEAKQRLEQDARARELRISLIRAIHEVSLDGILAVNPEGLTISVNKRFFDVWKIPVPFSEEQAMESFTGQTHKPILASVLPRVKDGDAFRRWARELYDDHNRDDHREIELKDGRTLEHYSTTLWSEERQYLGRIWFVRDISERWRAERSLQRSEQIFRQLAENLHVLIYMLSATGDGTLYISPAYEAIWERSREEVYRNMQLWMEVIHPEDRPAAQARFARQKLGESTIGEYRILTPTDKVKWIRNHAFPVRDRDGRVIRICGISEEITEQKRREVEMAAANRALRASEQSYRDIFEQAAVGIVQTAFDGRFLSCNARFAEIIGYSLDELPGLSMETITEPDDLAASKAALHLMERYNVKPCTLEKRYRRKDGSPIWVLMTVSIQRDEEGRSTNVISLIEDISDRKSAESRLAKTLDELKASEERYRSVIDLLPDAILVGRRRMITIANKAAVELFGLSAAGDLIGHRFLEFVREEDRDPVRDDLKRLYKREMQMPLREGRIIRGDGSLIDVEVSASSFQEGGETVVQAVIRDITERRRSEAEHARLVRGIEQVNESVFITDIHGTIQYVNPAFERVTGYSRSEAIGSNSRLLKSGHHPDSVYQGMWEMLLRGETWSGELVNRRKDGSQYTEAVTISPVKDASGTVINFVSVNHDMTQELLLRNQLNQAQKMEAVGQLAGGVAHDFNNLLMVIRTYAELLMDRLPAEDLLRGSTDQILKAVERGASLTGQMLAFSRKQITSPVELDLNTVIDETAKMLRRILGEDIEFRVALYEPLWAVKADPDQIVQVLMNLCVNARDAMPQGGSLTIETRNVSVEQKQIDEQHGIMPGDYVKLSVADSGVGMSEEVQRGIFEPFFTTKGVGKGTGLGLATIYGIVKQSYGHVWVESEPGHGACFTIYLPRIERATVAAIPVAVNAPPRGTETILVVEDEDPLRKGICHLLSSLGYTVLSAGSGDEALDLARAQDRIDLLLTDVVMPKMSGRELAEILGDQRPQMKIIYMSGYTDDAALRYGIHELRTTFLQKPFGLGALAQKVRDSLGQSDAVQ